MNVAILPVVGVLDKDGVLALSQACRALSAMPEVGKVVLLVDSPGGAAAGVADLAQDVRDMAARKPVVAYVRNLGASAGYWIASQASEVVASPSAFIGSLGVAAALVDTSKMAEASGVKVTLVTSGGVKGMGTPGTPITAEHIAEEQRIVDSIAAMFKADVAKGRNLDAGAVDALFDGRVHPAAEALGLKLIDRVGTFESTFEVKAAFTTADQKESTVSKETTVTKAESTNATSTDATGGTVQIGTANANAAVTVDHLAEDFRAIAAGVKEAGCILSVDSIVAKMTAGTKDIKDAMAALEEANKIGARLANLGKTVGSFAPKASPAAGTTASTVPTEYKAARLEWNKKFQENVKALKDPMEALVRTRDENPELHKALVQSATENWEKVRQTNGR